MAHSGGHDCHWCEAEFPWSHAMRRHDHRCARRFLRQGDPWRYGGVWGDVEVRNAPNLRTHAGIIADAVVSEASDLPWVHKQHPRRASGVDGPCPLALVPLFNLVWDVCMDFMHIVKVLISGHLLPLLKSKRGLSPPQVKLNAANDAAIRRYGYSRRTRLQPSSHGYNRHLTAITVGRLLKSGRSIARCAGSRCHGSRVKPPWTFWTEELLRSPPAR